MRCPVCGSEDIGTNEDGLIVCKNCGYVIGRPHEKPYEYTAFPISPGFTHVKYSKEVESSEDLREKVQKLVESERNLANLLIITTLAELERKGISVERFIKQEFERIIAKVLLSMNLASYKKIQNRFRFAECMVLALMKTLFIPIPANTPTEISEINRKCKSYEYAVKYIENAMRKYRSIKYLIQYWSSLTEANLYNVLYPVIATVEKRVLNAFNYITEAKARKVLGTIYNTVAYRPLIMYAKDPKVPIYKSASEYSLKFAYYSVYLLPEDIFYPLSVSGIAVGNRKSTSKVLKLPFRLNCIYSSKYFVPKFAEKIPKGYSYVCTSLSAQIGLYILRKLKERGITPEVKYRGIDVREYYTKYKDRLVECVNCDYIIYKMLKVLSPKLTEKQLQYNIAKLSAIGLKFIELAYRKYSVPIGIAKITNEIELDEQTEKYLEEVLKYLDSPRFEYIQPVLVEF